MYWRTNHDVFGYVGQYICQIYEPLSCVVICSEKYCLKEKTQYNIHEVADFCYDCVKCIEPSNEPSGEPSPIPSPVPSGEASAVQTSSPSHDPIKELTVFPSFELSKEPSREPSPVPSSAPSVESSAVPTSSPSQDSSKEPLGLPSLELSKEPAG